MRIVKNAKYTIICFLVLLCEMVFGKYLEIGGIVPMLSFSLCLANSMIEDEPRYVVTQAIVLGVLLDAFCGRVFGTYTITFLLASSGSYLVRDSLFSSKALLLVFDVFIMTLFAAFVFWLLNIWSLENGFFWMITNIAMPQAAYNIVVSLLFYMILKKISPKRR